MLPFLRHTSPSLVNAEAMDRSVISGRPSGENTASSKMKHGVAIDALTSSNVTSALSRSNLRSLCEGASRRRAIRSRLRSISSRS